MRSNENIALLSHSQLWDERVTLLGVWAMNGKQVGEGDVTDLLYPNILGSYIDQALNETQSEVEDEPGFSGDP